MQLKKIILLSIVILTLQINESYAFKWQNCRKIYKGSNNLLSGSTAALGSTSSYLSSTGDCAMIGMIEHDQKVFIAQNTEQLQIDIARGGGEYLASFAVVSGCHEKMLSPILQQNYDQIFNSTDPDPEQVYKQIKEVINRHNGDQKLCSPILTSGA